MRRRISHKKQSDWKSWLASTFLVMTALMVSCQSNVTISMTDTNPPTFRFQRHFFSEVNRFPLFIVEEIHPDNQPLGYLQQKYEKNKTIWKIVPDVHVPNAGEIDELPPITYGKVPLGFIQKTPDTGAPPSLEKDKLYEASGAYALMPDAVIRFKLEGDKVIRVPIPGQ